MKKLLVAFAVLCALFLFVSCNPEQEIVKVSAVSLDRTELSMTVGDVRSELESPQGSGR